MLLAKRTLQFILMTCLYSGLLVLVFNVLSQPKVFDDYAVTGSYWVKDLRYDADIDQYLVTYQTTLYREFETSVDPGYYVTLYKGQRFSARCVIERTDVFSYTIQDPDCLTYLKLIGLDFDMSWYPYFVMGVFMFLAILFFPLGCWTLSGFKIGFNKHPS